MARLHHVTLKTSRLAETIAFYERHLGLRPGPRPPFDVSGAWLYPGGGDRAILHLIEVSATEPQRDATGAFDHFAIETSGLSEYLERLKADGTWHRASPVPATDLVQIHHLDPSGVMVEATFVGEALPPGYHQPSA